MRVNRARRHGAARLPVRASPPSLSNRVTAAANAVSCWYCDLKVSAFNEPLFRFGRKHATILKLWFSIGTGFGLTALVGVTLILIWDLFLSSNSWLSNLFSSLLFGVSPSMRISLSDAGYLFVSTLVSVSVHEFGHAIALASEGIQLEYIAVFLAVLFPGALVAFDHDLLQALPRLTSLRVYCAGIWHNAMFCALCGLLLFLQPVILFPFYMHAESPLVLDVAPASPLSELLSPGDAIVSLDGVGIHDVRDWIEMTALLDKKILQNSSDSHYFKGFGVVDSRKGYCVPNALLEDSKKAQVADNQSVCPFDLTAFVKIHCFDMSKSEDLGDEDGHLGRRENELCLNTKDFLKLEKCGEGWGTVMSNGSSCACSEDESCLSPVQLPGLMWVEITYSRPYSTECLQLRSSLLDSNTSSDAVEQACGGTFVFVGDVISMAHSVQLTEYQPRWRFFLGEYLPNKLKKSIICTFHVSLTLALLNSLPVYFLDGESILEVSLSYFTSLSPRKRRTVLQICLVGDLLKTLNVTVPMLLLCCPNLIWQPTYPLEAVQAKHYWLPFGSTWTRKILMYYVLFLNYSLIWPVGLRPLQLDSQLEKRAL